ncbi:hypothetical protein AB0L41_46855 [Amycolatopsis mediterranei]|uniref:hypothetical protein n=1 Tax=Amycolatopsis mediterranei TaxID=33910 RepID=UPI003447D738
MALPTGRGIEVHTAVDLRVNFSAFSTPAESSDDVPDVRPVRFEELTNFFVRAWPTATVALLLAAVDESTPGRTLDEQIHHVGLSADWAAGMSLLVRSLGSARVS